MTDIRVARKYGHALFSLAERDKTEVLVWEELLALRTAFESDHRFLDLMAAPQVSDEDKHALARAVLRGATQPVVRNFVLFLIDRRRTDHLLSIIEDFRVRLDEQIGVVEATITSAVPLTNTELTEIIRHLESVTKQTIRHKTVVDAEILGGVVIMVGNEIIDHSVRHDLARLREKLLSLKVQLAA